MFGLSRNVTLALVGWLWADILLGLFVIFLAAASPPIPAAAKTGPSIDPQPVVIRLEVDGGRLLSPEASDFKTAQSEVARDLAGQLTAKKEKRAVAMVFAYGSHQDPVLGQKLAQRVIDAIAQGPTQAQFARAVMKPLHDIVPGDQGTKVEVEIYLFR